MHKIVQIRFIDLTKSEHFCCVCMQQNDIVSIKIYVNVFMTEHGTKRSTLIFIEDNCIRLEKQVFSYEWFGKDLYNYTKTSDVMTTVPKLASNYPS